MRIETMIVCTVLSFGGGCRKSSQAPSPAVVAAQRWPGQDPLFLHPDIIFIGDSIVQQWERPDMYNAALPTPSPAILNHAIGGQGILEIPATPGKSILANFDADVTVFHPRVVMVEGAYNDFTNGSSLAQVEHGYIDIYNRAKAAGLKIVVGTAPPVSTDPALCPNTISWDVVAKITQLNAFLAQLCSDRSRCVLADYNAAIGGAWNAALYKDCVHPNDAGHAKMDLAWDTAKTQL